MRRPSAVLVRAEALVLLGALAALVLVNVTVLGSEPWSFEPGAVDPSGPFASFVRGAGEEWDPEALRAPALLAGLLVVLAAAVVWQLGRIPVWAAGALAVVVLGLLAVPPVVLQTGLRQSTDPWFYTNDSTYQIELAGELLRDGENPYGHDYSRSGLERFYSLDGSVTEETREEQVALRHFAYFPGTVLTSAVWTLLPEPGSDYRFFVLLTTLAGFLVALLFRAPLLWRLVAGAAIAASPLAVRAAWFGTADAPSLLFTVLAFALVSRGRLVAAAASLGVAVALKQFALVALPFLALAALGRAPRRELVRAGAVFAGVLFVAVLPFFAWDPGAFWADTIEYGGRTYRIVGYGLSGLLIESGLLDSRTGPYPFLPLLFAVWLPATAFLLWRQHRTGTLWAAAAGFAASIFLLVFLARVFHGSYLVWPLAGLTMAFLLAAGEPQRGERYAGK
jgi:Glycosyltransferase family 87